MFDVGVDCDGVLHDFVQSLRRYVVDQGIRTEEQCAVAEKMDFFHHWYDDKGVGISMDEFKEICHAGVDAGVVFYHGEPFGDVRESLQRIRNDGHKIHIITDRTFGTNNYSHELTKKWFYDYDLPYDSITFSADKTRPITDIMIDDKIQNYQELFLDGCYAVLHTRPWNLEEDKRVRVNSMSEFADMVTCLTMDEIMSFDRLF